MRRVVSVIVCLVTILGLGQGLASSPVMATDDCSAFLIQEDAQDSGHNCPELPTLAQSGLVRPQPPAKAKRGRVRDIVDGDTIKVSFGDTVDTVRLVNINAPKTHNPNTPPQC